MTEYGVQPTGFIRKPLSVILAELEAALITEFGPGAIQTPQSPFGQLNGLFADLAAEVHETLEDVYQSYDPDQAEGLRLDMLGRLRLLSRNGRDDAAYRKAITNAGVPRVDLADVLGAVESIAGVTFVAVYSNETDAIDGNGLPPGSVAVAVIGGDDAEVAATIRQYIVPGVITFGNTRIDTIVDGFCRSVSVVRPIEVPVTLDVMVRLGKDANGCPPPSTTSIASGLVADWAVTNANGKGVNAFNVRSLIEARYPAVEVVSITAERDGLSGPSADIAFIEISALDEVTVTVI